MAEEIGLSPDTFYEVISNNSGASKVLDTKFEKMKNRQYDSGFQTKLLIKDMNIALNQRQHQDLQLLKKSTGDLWAGDRVYGRAGFFCHKQVVSQS